MTGRASPIRLLTWNIHKCKGSDGRVDRGRVLEVIRDARPDVAVLQEADERFGRRRGVLSPDEVERTCGLILVRSAGARPHSIGWHGNVLLLHPDIEIASMTNVALPSLEPRGAVIWRLRVGGRDMVVVGTHLGLLSRWRRLQAEEIARKVSLEDDVPTVVAGDLNEWRPRSETLKAIESELGTSAVGGPSFPGRRPILRLDRVAAGKGATIHSWEVLDPRGASDHRPLLARVNC